MVKDDKLKDQNDKIDLLENIAGNLILMQDS